jgi:2-polyprenyl-3-methyl-5-hydroxy-6-metoxy-1,4-benzoquinol methylase
LTETITACPLCAGTQLRPFAEDRGHRFVQCGQCSFVFIPVEEVRRGMIAEYAIDRPVDPEHVERYGYQRAAVYRQTLRLVRSLLPGGGRLLDVGCQFGAFLALAKEAGYDVAGVEVTHRHAEHARERLGGSVYDRPVEELNLPAESFDMVTYLDVVEHLEDPMRHLREAHRLLRPGGWIGVRVPNLLYHGIKMRVLERLFGRERAQELCRRSTFCGLQAPAHMNWFTARSLTFALEQAGFERPRIVLGRAELIKPDSLRRHAINALKQLYYAGAVAVRATTGVPVATLFALARKPAADASETGEGRHGA